MNHTQSITWEKTRALVLIHGFILWLLFLCPFKAHAQAVQYEVAVDAPLQIKALLTKNLDLIRWRRDKQINQFQLRRLYKKTPDEIRKLLTTEGFYSPNIESDIKERKDITHIRFHVDTGKPVLVDTVNLIFEGPILTQKASLKPDIGKLYSGWTLPSGTVFRHQDWEAAKTNLLRQVRKVRYPNARIVETKATVDPDAYQVALRVVIDSHGPVHFGAIEIKGLKRYPQNTVMAKSSVVPGDVYQEEALLKWQMQLLDNGYFRSAEVAADTSNESPVAPVKIKVAEYERKKLGLGLGYSTDTGKRATASYEDLSFFDRELRFKSALALETKRQTINANVLLPETSDGYQNSFGGRHERTNIEGEVVNLSGLNVQRVWGTPRLEHGLKLEYLKERATLDGVGTSHSQALPLTYSVTRRRLDNRLSPKRGYALHAQVGGALEPILTDRSYIRTYLKGIMYHPLGEKHELVLRSELGAVIADSGDGVPSDVQFRTGGDQSVRGYAYESLGVNRGTAVEPGRYLATASIEYQYWFLPKWGMALFTDAGNASDSFSRLDPAVGYGVGARWRSPVGPIGADIAYGRRTEEYRLHFSLGFTF